MLVGALVPLRAVTFCVVSARNLSFLLGRPGVGLARRRSRVLALPLATPLTLGTTLLNETVRLLRRAVLMFVFALVAECAQPALEAVAQVLLLALIEDRWASWLW